VVTDAELMYTGFMDAGISSEVVGMSATLLNVGTGVLVGAAVVFMTAVAWLYRSKFRDLKAMLMVALALIMMPTGVRLVRERTGWFTQASIEMKVENVQVENVRPGEVMVYFTTPKEAISYLEYTDTVTKKKTSYFPSYPIAKQRAHAVLVREVGVGGGEVEFVVDGHKLLWQGKPLEIK